MRLLVCEGDAGGTGADYGKHQGIDHSKRRKRGAVAFIPARRFHSHSLFVVARGQIRPGSSVLLTCNRRVRWQSSVRLTGDRKRRMRVQATIGLRVNRQPVSLNCASEAGTLRSRRDLVERRVASCRMTDCCTRSGVLRTMHHDAVNELYAGTSHRGGSQVRRPATPVQAVNPWSSSSCFQCDVRRQPRSRISMSDMIIVR